MTAAADPHQAPSVLITGATDGLGRAMGVFLAANGYRIFAAGRNAEKRASLDKLAAERNLLLETLDMDVSDDASVSRAVGRVLDRAGRIDVLINNAGVAYVAVLEELRLDDLRKQYETNVIGVLRVTQAVLPAMRERRSGRILNMSSIAGKIASPLMGAYASSKHALEGLSDSLRLELAPFGVRIVLIEPGFIPTNMANASLDLSAAYAAKAEKSPYAPVYRSFRDAWRKNAGASRTTPEDCARVILRAILDSPPRPRYTVTPRARIGVFVRRLLSDRMLDKRILRSMGLDKPL